MICAVVTDIEGTTSSLSFVKDVLFPYARARLRDFVLQNRQQVEVAGLLDEARAEMGDLSALDEAVIGQLIDWIDQDKKITALKSLQGLIWETGYRNGDFYGHVYPDAAAALRDWHAQGLDLYVYSSGSVYAQKLLFAHTEFGDLTELFRGYFDTHIGHKREAGSYRAIAREIGIDAGQVLFLSDIAEELQAADSAGMQVVLLCRDGSAGSGSFRSVTDFSQLGISAGGLVIAG